MSVDILDIDAKMRRAYDSRIAAVGDAVRTVAEMRAILQDESLKLGPRIRRDLAYDIEDLESEINYLDFFRFYFVETRSLLAEYVRLLQVPVRNTFSGSEDGNVRSEKYRIAREYLETVTSIPASRHCRIPYWNILRSQQQQRAADVSECCSTTSHNRDGVAACASCGSERLVSSNCSTFSDASRVNMSSRYTYDRKNHFRDCIRQYQGKQDKIIPQSVVDNVREVLERHRMENVTVAQVSSVLRSCGYTKHYDDAVLIHSMITGVVPDSIEDLEEKLVHDFDLILAEFTRMFKDSERKNFNTQYVLYQLLQRHNHACNKNQLVKLRSHERKAFSDDVCRVIFGKLGWEYSGAG